MSGELTWQQTLADALIEAGVEIAAWVPDKRLAPIGVRLAERGIPLRTLTREEECFGYAAGFRAAGGMPVVIAQCSGLGNTLTRSARWCSRTASRSRGAVDARHARRAQPCADAARPDDGGDARCARRAGVPAARPGGAAPVVTGAIAVADGARVLAPILLEAELDLA